MYGPQRSGTTGFLVADIAQADAHPAASNHAIERAARGYAMPTWVTLIAEPNSQGGANFRSKRPGDLANMTWWALDPAQGPSRGPVTGSYSFAFPARQERVQGYAYGLFRPLRTPHNTAQEYWQYGSQTDILDADDGYGLQGGIPGGVDSLVVSTVGHGDQFEERLKMAFKAFPLVAHHSAVQRDTTQADAYRPNWGIGHVHKFSIHIREVDQDGFLHPDRHAPLSDIVRVRQILDHRCDPNLTAPPGPCSISNPIPPRLPKYANTTELYGGFLNATETYKASTVIPNVDLAEAGYLPLSFRYRDAYGSWEHDGPMIPCSDKHLYGITPDERHVVAAGLSTNTYFVVPANLNDPKGAYGLPGPTGQGEHLLDAPMSFIADLYVPASKGLLPVVVERRYDAAQPHYFGCQTRCGMWREEAWISVTSAPSCAAEKTDESVAGKKTKGTAEATERDNWDNETGEGTLAPVGVMTPVLRLIPKPDILKGRPQYQTRYNSNTLLGTEGQHGQD